MRLNKIISRLSVVTLTLLPAMAMAAGSAPQDKSGDYNPVFISLVSLILILLFVIGMLANTLRMLGGVIKEKNRKEKLQKKSNTGTVAAVLLFAVCSFSALNVFGAAAAVAAPAAPVVSPFIEGIPKEDFYALISMITLELAVIFALAIYIRLLLRVINSKPGMEGVGEAVVKKSWFWDNFNQAVAVEKEKDILLDHDYDGIQELDNSLPPWWKYGFYLTIVVACIYFYRFHISHDGPSSQEEYIAAMEKGEEDKNAYLAKSANNVDENSVVLLTDPAEVGAGKEIFVKTCAACHLADGGGAVGPNLTDDYWLHGGSIKDIFKTIKYGWQDKGMKSWKDDYSPKQIEELASFVKSLRGTKPAVPKAPQGDLYIEATNKPVADSTKPKTDSAKAEKKADK